MVSGVGRARTAPQIKHCELAGLVEEVTRAINDKGVYLFKGLLKSSSNSLVFLRTLFLRSIMLSSQTLRLWKLLSGAESRQVTLAAMKMPKQ